MARTQQSSFNLSSPHSSSAGAESFKGTPDTRLTVFSPRVLSTKSTRYAHSCGLIPPSTAPVRFCDDVTESPQLLTDRDPFITTSQTASAASQLSPTASSFHPRPVPPNNTDYSSSASLSMSHTDAVNYDDHVQTRCLVLSSPYRQLLPIDAVAFLLKLEQLGILIPAPRLVIDKGGQIYVHFADVQSAVAVHDHVSRAAVKCEASYLSESEWRKDMTSGGGIFPKCQVAILALTAPPSFSDPRYAELTIQDILRSQGSFSAYRRLMDDGGPGMHAGVAEFLTTGAGTAAVAALNGRTVQGIVLHLAVVQSDGLMSSREVHNGHPGTSSLRVPGLDLPFEYPRLSLSTSVQGTPPVDHRNFLPASGPLYSPSGPQPQPPWGAWPVFGQSFYRPSLPYSLGDGHPVSGVPLFPHSNRTPPASHIPHASTMPQRKRHSQLRHILGCTSTDAGPQSALRVSRAQFRNAPSHHNHVDINKICEGTDVRTTIMLRNIPNKVDQAMLKRIVDESSWGKYDFMYLRIDFANDCNVGYAFINFVDPLDIIDFVRTRGNQRWNCFKSDKVAEISYATIQGKDCLVQKFRNSSVMLEPAHYRPKLFYTSNGPMPRLAGQEEPFPSPDNQSKMKRSCENAEHVGLFTPNASQHFRDQQRRRRSQYDRGTRLAALEEHELESTTQPYTHFG
ncbi:hypothetical protein SODALDRAFT_329819 [Sodiomyces alkalinus F11]|uniref:RRM domain-containing protein n=1 Tax=Sodiomyces alkalinus (strain CBS 110278 / VKM F-3762 / F11) TaxID=1314773 RepID=A0A3N2Q0L4_SODAK|nr:hypothetical protein SODALDRAFT_329819 [Sodiomyces alkalinus F11]ROT40155.1 hypothetical protein SODALDRAFT_329819 [Sodiomyces alkalinus F11]